MISEPVPICYPAGHTAAEKRANANLTRSRQLKLIGLSKVLPCSGHAGLPENIAKTGRLMLTFWYWRMPIRKRSFRGTASVEPCMASSHSPKNATTIIAATAQKRKRISSVERKKVSVLSVRKGLCMRFISFAVSSNISAHRSQDGQQLSPYCSSGSGLLCYGAGRG